MNNQVIATAFLEETAKSVNHLKDQIANNVIEIGRHLAQAKEMLTPKDSDRPQGWGRWLEQSVYFNRNQADSYIRIFRRFGNQLDGWSANHLGFQKMKLLAELPEEEANQIIEEKDLSSKTIKELKEIISGKSLSDVEREQIKRSAYEIAKIDVRKTLEAIIEKTKGERDLLNQRNRKLIDDHSRLKFRFNEAEEKLRNAKELKMTQNQIDRLKNRKQKLESQINEFSKTMANVEEVAHAHATIEDFLKHQLAPLQFTNIFNKGKVDPVLVGNLAEILGMVDSWLNQMYKIIESNKNIIEVKSG